MHSDHLLPLLLPSFLQLLPALHDEGSRKYLNAKFTHSRLLGDSHALWWPAKNGARPQQILLFIPGNPGLVEFYVPFLSNVHDHFSGTGLAILAHALLDHSPSVHNASSRYPVEATLTIQVEACIEILDQITTAYPGIPIVTVGHSLGGWIIVQMLKARQESIKSSFLLFPALSNLASTPGGQLCGFICAPLPRWILSSLSPLLGYLPDPAFSRLFPNWPARHIGTLKRFLSSSSCVDASLATAHTELETIVALDLDTLDRNRERLWFYYGEKDHWVGEEKESFLEAFDPNRQSTQILHGSSEVPHAFCINHSDLLAKHCVEWLDTIYASFKHAKD